MLESKRTSCLNFVWARSFGACCEIPNLHRQPGEFIKRSKSLILWLEPYDDRLRLLDVVQVVGFAMFFSRLPCLSWPTNKIFPMP